MRLDYERVQVYSVDDTGEWQVWIPVSGPLVRHVPKSRRLGRNGELASSFFPFGGSTYETHEEALHVVRKATETWSPTSYTVALCRSVHIPQMLRKESRAVRDAYIALLQQRKLWPYASGRMRPSGTGHDHRLFKRETLWRLVELDLADAVGYYGESVDSASLISHITVTPWEA